MLVPLSSPSGMRETRALCNDWISVRKTLRCEPSANLMLKLLPLTDDEFVRIANNTPPYMQ